MGLRSVVLSTMHATSFALSLFLICSVSALLAQVTYLATFKGLFVCFSFRLERKGCRREQGIVCGIIGGCCRRHVATPYQRIPFLVALRSHNVSARPSFRASREKEQRKKEEIQSCRSSGREGSLFAAARNGEKAHGIGACEKMAERSGRECGLTVYGSFSSLCTHNCILY